MNQPADMPEDTEPKPSRTVAIGASAGGLNVCTELLAHLPKDTGLAFIVVLHLDPTRESHLAELLGKSTEMSVTEVRSDVRLEADHLYVIVPDTSLSVDDGMLRPTKLETRSGVRKPVNALFSALAESAGEQVVAVVLSGTADDGAAGLKDVSAAGGVCFAQDPDDAEYDGMPRAAISTGVVDFVGSPTEIAEQLGRLARGERVAEDSRGERMPVTRTSDEQTPDTPSDSPEDLIDPESPVFGAVLDTVSDRHGIEFDHYRRATLTRRVSRRMSLSRVPDLRSYLELLETDEEEVDHLYQDVLIDVTSFFRDAEVWELLREQVIPEIVENHDGENPLRLWIPACSSGEEAYGYAILVLECLQAAGRDDRFQIFATDINSRALEIGRRGLYPSTIAEEVSEERLARFFNRHGDQYQVTRRLRELVTFAVHDVLINPPFSRMDLVSCRNLLIYLEPKAQKHVMDLVRYAPNPGGYLVLGTSESVGQHGEEFEVISKPCRIFKSTATTSRGTRKVPRWLGTASRVLDRKPVAAAGSTGSDVRRYIEQHILGRYTPASVTVNENLNILHFYGPTEDFLTAPAGEAQFDLLAWLRPGLYARVRAGLEQAIETNEPVDVEEMHVERGSEVRQVGCRIEPLTSIPGAEGLYLVTFRESAPLATPDEGEPAGPDDRSLVRQLEAQLRTARQDQRQLVEQLETTSEEYQAHHEELLSLNEEFQSTNEELETSKEELQSLNEEMITINRELEAKNLELRDVNADLNNLLQSTDIPTIFLDANLDIRRYTPASTRIMRLVPSDVGRSIQHVKERFADSNLVADAAAVLAGKEPIQTEVRTDDGRTYVKHVSPYRTDEGAMEGVSITFTDITRQKQAAAEIEEAREYAEAIVRTIRTPLLVLASELHIVSANEAFHQQFGTSEKQVSGENIFELDDGQWDIPGLRELLEKILPERSEVEDYTIEHDFSQYGWRYLRLNARSMHRPDREPLILLSMEDLTERRHAELEARQRAEQLVDADRRKNEFLAMLGHELRNPLAALSYGLQLQSARAGESPKNAETSDMMVRQLTRMTTMLDQLLEMSRVGSGKLVLESEPVDLTQVAHDAVEAVAPLMEAHNHELTQALAPDNEVVVRGDSNRLAQVLENLLTNAAKYTDDGGQIALSVERDGEDAVMMVRDSGVGIEPDLLPHVFDLFTQASRTLQRSEGGLGLGLPLARDLVEIHGGTLTAHSEGLGHGSEFVITLPLADEVPEDDATPSTTGEHHPRRVLIIEDEDEAASALAMLLTNIGHETRTASDGPSALDIAPSFHPEVVLLDLGLPGMDGYEVARKLRAGLEGENACIIALTGYREDRDALEAAGFDRHMLKPPDVERLLSWISSDSRAN